MVVRLCARLSGLAVLLLGVGLRPPPAAAQARGGLEGRVVDQSGLPLPDATVAVHRPGGGGGARVAQTTSDGSGGWRLGGLPPGTYEVVIRRVGYRPATLAVEVTAGRLLSLDATLDPVPISLDSLIVSAPAVRISTGDAEISNRLTVRELTLLPTAFDPRALIAYTNGARPDQIWGGASDQANTYLLDGVVVNHPGLGGAFAQPSVSWIESIEVKGLGAGAEYEDFQGGLVTITTRSGGNTVEGSLRTAFESHRLNGSNLVAGEIGRELGSRWELDAQVRGPIRRDRLHYALFGHYIREEQRVLNQLPGVGSTLVRQAPQSDEGRWLAKATWQPGARDLVRATVAGVVADGDRVDQTGFETPGAARRLNRHTVNSSLTWQRTWSPASTLELRLGGYTAREHRRSTLGSAVPAVQTLVINDPFTFQNAPFTVRGAPSSVSAALTWTRRSRIAGWEHTLKVGGSAERGGWSFDQIRTGGVTWRPFPKVALDPARPATWPTGPVINSSWGGEIRLDSDVRNLGGFVQDYIALTPWLHLNPGLRFGSWTGYLTPLGGSRFRAVSDEALDPRIGLVVDLDRRGGFVAKAHWGRYHQPIFAGFFDRVAGASIFTDEQLWAYRLPPFSDPATTFTPAERDALSQTGGFTLEETTRLAQEGRVENYRQPYVDQGVLALEKTFGPRWKATAAYVRRRNQRMVALVDRNLDSNFTVYSKVQILDRFFRPLRFDGKPLEVERLAVSNEDILFWFDLWRRGVVAGSEFLAPGLTIPQLLALRYEPDLVLTTAPGATRLFKQLQLQLEARYPTWWAVVAATVTSLRGNLNTVTGPDDFTDGGPGQWVRLNEQFNSFGNLSNQSPFEAKLQVGGLLPGGFRGGVFLSHRSGDRLTPTLTVSRLLLEANVLIPRASNPSIVDTLPLGSPFFRTTSGQRIFVLPRGELHLENQTVLDLHLERSFPRRGSEIVVMLDAFNALGVETVTAVETGVNAVAPPFGSDFGRVRGRVQPRTIRVGATVRF